MKITYIKFLFSVLFFILLLQILNLQVIKGKYFLLLSEGNRIKLIREEAPRGRIFDRYGRQLVGNDISFTCALLLSNKKPSEKVRLKLSRLLNIPVSELNKLCNANHSYYPVEIKSNLDIETLTRVKEDFDLGEVVILTKPQRVYPGNTLSHFLGYIGKITKEEINLLKDKRYKITDRVGKSGLEYSYDTFLRGEDGGQQIEVDATGKIVRVIGRQDPKRGSDLYLTIDKDIQEIAENAMDGFVGAAVVMNPLTGEILAIVSSPRIGVDLSQGIIKQNEWEKILSDPNCPLQNRAISNKYPPGSIFKIITSTAALEEGKVSKNSNFFCRGYIYSGKRRFRCWKRDGHKNIDFVSGIAKSCDIVFYQVSKQLGHRAIHKWASLFGIGKKTGIDLPGEVDGTLPSYEYKLKRFGKKWYEGDTLNLGIGQGFLQVTPLQMAVMTSVIASGGKYCKPYIVQKIKSQDKEISILPDIKHLPISKETINVIKSGMLSTVEWGTGIRCKIDGIQVAGKTGTAEDPPRKEPHSWFVSFAPADKPKVVIVVFVEQGGSGGGTATTITRKIYEEARKKSKYFKEEAEL